MGRIHESEQAWRAGLAVEQGTKPSAMIGTVLSMLSAGLASLDADQGNRQAAEAAVAAYAKFLALSARDLPPDSFSRAAREEFGAFGLGILSRYALPLGAGDYPTVRNLARTSIQRGEALKPGDKLQEFIKNSGLAGTYAVLADASYNLKDYAAADKEIKLALDYRRRMPMRTLQDELDFNETLTLAAMIAARLERFPEAQQIIEPVVKFHRGLYARGKENDDLSQHVQYARALYVSALANPGQKASQLADAAGIIDRLPPLMRRQVSIALWRDRIAEEQKTRR
jgi:tetratricopeptide (TPR) repeat protein